MTGQGFVAPDIRFYHAFDFPDGSVTGDWDLRGRFDEYVGHAELAGKSLLDVGTASGFLAFEAEKRGARVTSFDAASADDWQLGPGEPIDHRYFGAMRRSYDYAHRALGSKVVPLYGNIYSMAKVAGEHDVVLLGQILVHLRDPLSAMEQAALCARETLIIAEGMMNTEEPLAQFTGGQPGYTWWYYSRGIYRQWLTRLGFEVRSFSEASYRCVARDNETPICTVVADRTAPPPRNLPHH